MYTLEDARTAIDNADGHNPMTWDARLNFLIDVELGLMEEDEWGEEKELYEEEVEAYKRDDVDLEPYDPDELLD